MALMLQSSSAILAKALMYQIAVSRDDPSLIFWLVAVESGVGVGQFNL